MIYADRPFACREHLVISAPEQCADPSREGVRPMFVPVEMSAALQCVCAAAGAAVGQIPLSWALDWVAAHPEVATATFDGVALFQVLMQDVEQVCRALAQAAPGEAVTVEL